MEKSFSEPSYCYTQTYTAVNLVPKTVSILGILWLSRAISRVTILTPATTESALANIDHGTPQ